MKESKTLEGPAGYVINTPDGAEKLPTKHYPMNDALAHKGKHNSIEGPCDGKEGYHK
jgi:hypothetical protein